MDRGYVAARAAGFGLPAHHGARPAPALLCRDPLRLLHSLRPGSAARARRRDRAPRLSRAHDVPLARFRRGQPTETCSAVLLGSIFTEAAALCSPRRHDLPRSARACAARGTAHGAADGKALSAARRERLSPLRPPHNRAVSDPVGADARRRFLRGGRPNTGCSAGWSSRC